MSSQKNENRIKLGISLKLTQKPTLMQCNEIDDLDPGCYRCYRMYPNGFYCPNWKIINIGIGVKKN